MYKICIYNDGQETLIHYPTADKEAPHLLKMDLQEKDNDIDTFSFTILNNNPGYNFFTEFKTKIKIIDIRDNSIRFIGRILKPVEKMDDTGFYNEVSCENALAYLLDSNTRDTAVIANTLVDALTFLLNRHNSSVEVDKQILLGNVNVNLNTIVYNCNFEPTLNAMLNMLKDVECHLQVREANGLLYLDCLQALSESIIDVRLGMNMKEMIKTNDPTNIGTRIIPLGSNNLTIASVNNNIDYIEDSTAKSLYGIIEKTVSYSDITDPTELKNTCMQDLSNYTQPLLTFEISADDLSFLTGKPVDVFKKGIKLHIINPVMGIDDNFDLVQVDADLTQVYNPKLTVSNIPTKIQDIISNIQNTSITNNSVHNGVQVGDDFGIRVVSGNAVTTLNATEGISIENNTQKVFFVDTDGKLCAKELKTNNSEDYIILHDQYIEFFNSGTQIAVLGFETFDGDAKYPALMLGQHIIWMDPEAENLKLDNALIATQDWVTANFQAKSTS